jgi:hypothetical protein
MLAKKIIENLKNEDYRVEYREHCDCRFDWSLDNGELVCDIATTDGDCWYDNALVMDDLAGQCDDKLSVGSDGVIAIYDAYFGLAMSWLNASCATEQEIINAIKDSDAYQLLTDGINSPDANNDLHDRRKREALVKWLSDNDYLRTYVYYPSDFANEYVCVLLVLPRHYYIADYLQIPAHWYPKSADKWAEMFLQKDTDGTRYDIGFELIDELYEIDYCWYDRHAGATVSHDTERYYFVDLQAAEIFLDTLGPEDINCYELNKLSVDYDGEIMEIGYITTKWETKVEK